MKWLIFLLLLSVLLFPVETATCSPAIPGCLSCESTNPASCNRCDVGYHFSFSGALGVCSKCKPGTGRGADLFDRKARTYCTTTCAPECSICGASPTECYGCKEGYRYNAAGKYCQACLPNTGAPADTEARTTDSTCSVACDPDCRFCGATATTCVGCHDGFMLNFALRKCELPPLGKGKGPDSAPLVSDSSVALPCSDENAVFCSGLTAMAFGCKAGFSYSLSFKTCTKCPAGFTRPADTTKQYQSTTCDIPCPPGCVDCDGAATKCFRCKAGYSFSASDKTCTICPAGTGSYLMTETSSSNVNCGLVCQDKGCLVCGPGNMCLACRAGYKFNAATQSCSPCEAQKGRAEDSLPLPVADTSCSVDCAAGCKFCGATPAQCLGCEAGFRLDYSTNQCVPCTPGYTKPLADTEPQISDTFCSRSECLPGCASCAIDGSKSCNQCAAGYRTEFVGGVRNCIACTGGQGRAEETLPNTSTNTQCNIECRVGCENCSGDFKFCVSCTSGYYMSAPGVCSLCPIGRGKVRDLYPTFNTPSTTSGWGECSIVCADGCGTCRGTTATQCLNCDGHFWFNGLNSCTRCSALTQTKNPDKYTFKIAGEASQCSLTCDESCVSCRGIGASSSEASNQCSRCKQGYYAFGINSCNRCPAGTGKALDSADMSRNNPLTKSQLCTACSSQSCKYCGAPNQCVECYDGYKLNNGACDLCIDKTGASGGTSTTCGLTCDKACESCSTASDNQACLMCSAGHYMEAPKQCSKCPDNSGKAKDLVPVLVAQSSGACSTPCESQCKLCGADPSSCVSCSEGYFWASANTCTKCPPGTGKAAGSVFPTMAEMPNSCTACSAGCQWCSSSAQSDCFRCSAGFFRSTQGICQQCPSGKGKAADAANTNTTPYPSTGTGQCDVTCSPKCLLCSGSAGGSCLMCDSGYYLTTTGCQACSPGNGKPADTTIQNPSNNNSDSCTGTTCSAKCTLCGSSSTQCIRCNVGFYLSATGVCSQCPAGKGKDADTSDPSPNSNGDSACENSCPPGCLLCNGAQTCLMCDKGYFFSGPGCVQCSTGNGKPADTTIQTVAVGPLSCLTCHANCALCFGTNSDQCLMCSEGFYKSAANTCSRCPIGKTRAVDTTETLPFASGDLACSLPCDAASNCYNCESGSTNKCLSCPEGYFLSGGPTAPVCSVCNNGNTKAADATNSVTSTDAATACNIPCGNRCKGCLASNTNFCLLCAGNFFWTAAGTCSRCNDGRGKATETAVFSVGRLEANACTACAGTASHCKGCFINSASTEVCNRCFGGEFLKSDGLCAVCPENKGKAADTDEVSPGSALGNTECDINCHENCRNCFGPGPQDCTTCKRGFYMASVGICSACPVLTGKPADTVSIRAPQQQSICATCHDSCRTCFGTQANECTSCKAGTFLASTGTCSLCDGGRGRAADSVIPEGSTTSSAACTITCHKTCNLCSGPLATDCLSCAAGFWYQGAGVCTQCDAGKGKAADNTILSSPANKETCTTAQCHESCLICRAGTTSGHCVKCSAGHYMASDNTCTMCPAGSGRVADVDFPVPTSNAASVCDITCHSSCRTCSNSTPQGCLNCKNGYFMSALGTCTLCSSGKGSATDTGLVTAVETQANACITCDDSCLYCVDNTAGTCLACKDGYFLNDARQCTQCPEGLGKSADTGVLAGGTPNSNAAQVCTSNCHPSCKLCKGPGASDCLNCNQGYWWAGNGQCSECPSGSGKDHDGTTIQTAALDATQCSIECHTSCRNCFADTATSCLSCEATYFHSSAGTCARCPISTGKARDATVKSLVVTAQQGCSVACAVECSICFGPGANQCLTCSAGHHMSATNTCTKCPLGRGKVLDATAPSVTTGDINLVCNIECHESCSSCASTSASACVGCNQRFFWQSDSTCRWCPAGTSKPAADTTGFLVAQAPETCTLKCHASCQHCTGPGENECTSCNPGFFRSAETVCSKCPNGKGKAADVFKPTSLSTEDACNIFCDSCSSGCQTCSENPSECVSCVSDRFLTTDKTCGACPDNCLSCSKSDTCATCAKNFKVTTDGKGCTGDCTVENCILCAEDPAKCTKCSEPFLLKSATQCVEDSGVVVQELSSVSVLESPKLNLDIRSDKLELTFSQNESRIFTSVTLLDKLKGKTYTCAEVSCTYSIVNDKLNMNFNPDFAVVQGKLTIERAAAKTAITPASIISQLKRRKMQTQSDYPIIIDGISLMKNSALNPLSFTLRVIVGILRLPLSLLVYWKYPYLAMMMDHMVTHLKIFSLLGHPYMAYVEVVFQSVSESKVLPFNFNNPFENWDSSTLDCAGFPGIRNKNLHCSWLDNYGQNFIGLLAVGLLLLILYYGSRHFVRSDNTDSWLQRVFRCLLNDYGLKFMVAKLDGNHVEIVLMTVIAYCTADGSSKSVIGIILSTLALAAFAALSLFVTWQNQRIHQAHLSLQSATGKGISQLDPEVRLVVMQGSDSRAQNSNPTGLKTSPVRITEFVTSISSDPQNKWSVYFFAARYLRALLLTIFVTTVRDSVEQVVLVVILESVYLVSLILFDVRGTPAERLFYTTMHGLLLVHLILRAAATSENLSEKAVQSNLASGIVVLLLIYIFCHIVLSLVLLIGIFLKNTQTPAAKPADRKIEFTEPESSPPLPKANEPSSLQRDQAVSKQSNWQVSFFDMNIPEEIQDDQNEPQMGVPEESRQQMSKANHHIGPGQFAPANAHGTQAGTQGGVPSQ